MLAWCRRPGEVDAADQQRQVGDGKCEGLFVVPVGAAGTVTRLQSRRFIQARPAFAGRVIVAVDVRMPVSVAVLMRVGMTWGMRVTAVVMRMRRSGAASGGGDMGVGGIVAEVPVHHQRRRRRKSAGERGDQRGDGDRLPRPAPLPAPPRRLQEVDPHLSKPACSYTLRW